jgi:hypothetical protein
LYGSTTVSETFGDGKTEKVNIILSGYSSLILEIRRVPMPDPVPPPKEWQTWNPASSENKAIILFTYPSSNADAKQKYALNCKKNRFAGCYNTERRQTDSSL